MGPRSLRHFKEKRAQVHWRSEKKTQVHLTSERKGASTDMRLFCMVKRRLNFVGEERKCVYDIVSRMARISRMDLGCVGLVRQSTASAIRSSLMFQGVPDGMVIVPLETDRSQEKWLTDSLLSLLLIWQRPDQGLVLLSTTSMVVTLTKHLSLLHKPSKPLPSGFPGQAVDRTVDLLPLDV